MSVYRVGLRGESHYQAEIKKCFEGQLVRLVHEPTNKFDKRAIVALVNGDTIIGYAPKDSFVQRAVIDEGWVAIGHIESIMGGTRDAPMRGIVAQIELCTTEEASRIRDRPRKAPSNPPTKGGFLAGILKGFRS